MAEKKVEVFYQAPGETTWRRVRSEEKEKAKALRRSARSLLAEADVAAIRLFANVRPAGLTPVEAFERQMAAALGAWGRYMAIEVRRFNRGVDIALEELLGKKR